MFQYVIAGLVFGSIYALSASGLVVTYRSAGILNFSFGAIAFAVARLYYALNTEHGWSVLPAFLVSVFVAAPLIGLILYVILFRYIQLSSTLVKIVVTIGVAVTIPPIVNLVFGDDPILLAPGIAPRPLKVFDVFGVAVTMDQVVVYACVLIVLILGVLVLRYTDIGLRVRAMVDSPAMTATSGTNPRLVAGSVWAASAFLAGLVGVVSAPIVGLDAASFTLLMIAAFAAVIAARLHSIAVAVAVGLAMGIAGSVLQFYLPPSSSLTQAAIPSIPFAVTAIFLAYNVMRRRAVDEGRRIGGTLDHSIVPHGQAASSASPTSRRSDRLTVVSAVVCVLVVAVLPQILTSFWVTQLALGVVFGIVFLSFTLVVGEGGMIWLCIATFAGVGAITAAQLATVHGWPLGLAVVGGGGVAMAMGLVIGMLSIRLGALYLALVTLTFGLLMENLVFTLEDFANLGSGVSLARPAFAQGDTEFTYFALGVFSAVALLIVNLRRSTTGLALGAVRSSADASRTIGVSVLQMKVLVAGLAAFVAGVGGALMAMQRGSARPTEYATLLGLVWLAVLVSLGIRSTIAALVAGIAFTLGPAVAEVYLPSSWGQIPPILFGLGAIVIAKYPDGAIAMNARHLRAALAKMRARHTRTATGGLEASTGS
ncbi:MAG: ABC transporter permease [Acidimicrobiia bacterium]